MAWKDEIDITKYHIAAAPYGGPIGELKYCSQCEPIGRATRQEFIYLFHKVPKLLGEERKEEKKIKRREGKEGPTKYANVRYAPEYDFVSLLALSKRRRVVSSKSTVY